jgi:hypothetical protein
VVLDCLVLHLEVGGQLVLVSWLVTQELDDSGATWASSAAPQNKPEQTSELWVVAHLELKGILVILAVRTYLDEIWTNG